MGRTGVLRNGFAEATIPVMTTTSETPGGVEPPDLLISSAVKQLMAVQDRGVPDVSYNAGIPISTLYRKLNGNQAWKASDIVRVARYLGVTPNDLFSGRPLPEGASIGSGRTGHTRGCSASVTRRRDAPWVPTHSGAQAA